MGPLLEVNSEAAFVAILEPGPHFGVVFGLLPSNRDWIRDLVAFGKGGKN